jgi:hypothetical protein
MTRNSLITVMEGLPSSSLSPLPTTRESDLILNPIIIIRRSYISTAL